MKAMPVKHEDEAHAEIEIKVVSAKYQQVPEMSSTGVGIDIARLASLVSSGAHPALIKALEVQIAKKLFSTDAQLIKDMCVTQ